MIEPAIALLFIAVIAFVLLSSALAFRLSWSNDENDILRRRVSNLEADNRALNARNRTLDEASEMLWVVLANVSGGDWTQQSPKWREAAAYWRDNYFKTSSMDHVFEEDLPRAS